MPFYDLHVSEMLACWTAKLWTVPSSGLGKDPILPAGTWVESLVLVKWFITQLFEAVTKSLQKVAVRTKYISVPRE